MDDNDDDNIGEPDEEHDDDEQPSTNNENTVYPEIGPSEAAMKPKMILLPVEPTATERALHEITHLPYRSWCKHCVAGKGKQTPHRHGASHLPVVQIDYAYDDSRGRRQSNSLNSNRRENADVHGGDCSFKGSSSIRHCRA